IITEETGQNLTKYYGPVEPEDRMQTILTIFGVLGAVFVGLGIISMIAYNWSDLPRIVKTILSFAPLLIGQAICLFVILKKYHSVAWKEAILEIISWFVLIISSESFKTLSAAAAAIAESADTFFNESALTFATESLTTFRSESAERADAERPRLTGATVAPAFRLIFVELSD
ncbi:MAG: DUF2157 domain-containing protein, partial [Sphingobacteriales bacterium]